MFYKGKQVDDKTDIGGWPSVRAFGLWKLSFKKAVAAASRRSKVAFTWITEVELAEDLADSGDFEELEAKLSKYHSKILAGEFKKGRPGQRN